MDLNARLANPQQQYEKNPDLKDSDVNTIRTWVKEQQHLPELSELQIILFLHCCQYDLEKTQIVIDKYFTQRTAYPDIFNHATEDVIRSVLSTAFIRVLPGVHPEGYMVVWMKLLDTNPKNYDPLTHSKLNVMIMILHLHLYGCNKGLIMVHDMDGVSLSYMLRFNRRVFKQISIHVQEAIPLMIKSIHYINSNSLTQKCMQLVRPFIRNEIMKKIVFHTNSLEELKLEVPNALIPKEYGGDGDTIENLTDSNIKELVDNLEFFKWHDSQVVDESKRAPKEHTGGFFSFWS